jgi:FkbM family methyltransferase
MQQYYRYANSNKYGNRFRWRRLTRCLTTSAVGRCPEARKGFSSEGNIFAVSLTIRPILATVIANKKSIFLFLPFLPRCGFGKCAAGVRVSIELSNLAKRAGLRIRTKSGLLFGKPFVSESEKTLYRQIVRMPEDHGNHPAIVFHPRCLGGNPILCRPGTRDRSSLQDLLFYQTYLPPKAISQPKVIVDLGTNVGYTVAHFASLYPSARIIGVELDAGNFLLAQENTRWCTDRVTLINAAIWSSDGYVNFDGPGEDAFHVVGPAVADNTARSTTPARQSRSLTMATLIKDFDIARIDYLKMDIEGAEAEILLAADPSWLALVSAMKIELHDVDYDDFDKVLSAHGFRCYPDNRHPSCIVAVRD